MHLSDPLACPHRGGWTGETRPPVSGPDKGRVALRLYRCERYGVCTLNRPAEGVPAVCRSCEVIAARGGPPPPPWPPKSAKSLLCVHEGRDLERTDGMGEPCSCKAKWVHDCEEGYGPCTRTRAGLREGVRLCEPRCPGYEADG